MRSVKWTISALLALVLIFALLVTACGGDEATDVPAPTETPKVEETEKEFWVGLIVATGGLGDQSFNDSGYNGVLMAQEKLGIQFDYVEPNEIAEYEGHERAFARDGKYDLIIGLGFDQADSMSQVAADYPDQKWMMVDGGFAHMVGDELTILTERAELASAIDVDEAEQALERANAEVVAGGLDRDRAEIAQQRARVRVGLARR